MLTAKQESVLRIVCDINTETGQRPRASEVSTFERKPKYWAGPSLRALAQKRLVISHGLVPPFTWSITDKGREAIE